MHSVNAFSRLNFNIWKPKQYSLQLKLRSTTAMFKTVLLHGSECCCVVKRDMQKVYGSFRKICQIFWPNEISNEDLYKKTKSQSIILEITKRRFSWLGHILRMPRNRIPRVALHWKKGRGNLEDLEQTGEEPSTQN